MLEEEDQLRLLNLLTAAIIYLSFKQEEGNPFVKKWPSEEEKKALELLTSAVNNLEHLLPIIKQIDEDLDTLFKEEIVSKREN